MTVSLNEILWVLELRGTLLTQLLARNALKSNVTWSSYPFVPPTGASGFFADLLGGMKCYETNDNRVRHLNELPDYRGVFALGAYPTTRRLSPPRRHFRAHIGSLAFSYEAYVWVAGRREGKKLAVVEDYLIDELRFVVAAHESEPLRRLHQAVRGRVARIAKKGWIQLEYTAEPCIIRFQRREASDRDRLITLVPLSEAGEFYLTVPYRVSIRSEGTSKGIQWYTQDSIWSPDTFFRPRTLIYADERNRGVSASLLRIIEGQDNEWQPS